MQPGIARDLAELEGLPLLGEGRTRAGELLAGLAPMVLAEPEIGPRLRLISRAALLSEATEAWDAVARLTEARDAWREAGHLDEALRLHLRACRALARRGGRSEARHRLGEVEGRAAATPGLAAELALARAETRPEERRSDLEAALALLPSPSQDHDRLVVLLDLAELHRAGGDLSRATGHLEAALGLAQRHGDAPALSLVTGLLADLLVARGLPGQAEPLLTLAVELAEGRGDELSLVARGLVLEAVLLERGDWEGVIHLGKRVALAARARGAWLAVAGSAISSAAALQALGAAQQGVDLLVDCYHRLSQVGARAAANVVRARLAEVRLSLGPEVFDPALALAVERRRPREG